MADKNQKPKESRTRQMRITDQAHRKLAVFKAVNGCGSLSEAIEKLLEGKK